jgi:hypothetical protein
MLLLLLLLLLLLSSLLVAIVLVAVVVVVERSDAWRKLQSISIKGEEGTGDAVSPSSFAGRVLLLPLVLLLFAVRL